MKRELAIYLLALAVLPAYAGDGFKAMTQKQKACGDLSSYSQLYGCYQEVHKESDALLNKEYRDLSNYLSGAHRKHLVDAQRNWMKFRDSDCYFADPREEDGSIASANRAACLAERTIERLKQLEDYNVPWNKGCNGCPW